MDIVITKATRFNACDEEDIAKVAKYVNKDELIIRFKEGIKTYAEREEDYNENISYILKKYFSSKKN